MVLVAVVGVVLLALLFDFTNGFHDAANSTSTVVATRAMKPRHAVYMAAFFNFAALFVVGTAVANTVAKTVQVEELGVQSGGVPVGLGVAFGALLGAIFWNYFTWSIGMPSSSSHALIGGLIGAGLSAGGTDVIKWSSVEKTALAIVALPAGRLHRGVRGDVPRRTAAAADALEGRRQAVQVAADHLVRGRVLRPRRQRRPEDDGPDRLRPGRRWLPRRGRRDPAVGRARRLLHDRPGHHVGRLEDHRDHGPADHQAERQLRRRGQHRRGHRPSSAPPSSASRSPPPRRPPPRSWVPARRRAPA